MNCPSGPFNVLGLAFSAVILAFFYAIITVCKILESIF